MQPSLDPIRQHYNMRVGVNAVIVRAGAVLAVEFNDENGPHYNLPGGGVENDEPILAGLQREVREETAAEVTVGPLLFVTEYFPPRHEQRYGPLHKLTLFFRCTLLPGSEPRLPARPDPHQVGVRWLPLDTLQGEALLPFVLTERLPGLIAANPLNLFSDTVDLSPAGA
jgi:ADP-ribose pyrophosphatase YjhB (NUDIX family)